MAASSEKVLALKAQRSQLETKLQEWESTFATIHNGRVATAADRQRSHEHRQLSRLLVDVDEYVLALEKGTADSLAPPGSQDAERRAERGRIKARMRRWERDYERRLGRKPTEAEIEASEEMERMRQQLKGTVEAADGGFGVGIALTASCGGSSSSGSNVGLSTPPPVPLAANAAAPGGSAKKSGGGWSHGNDYHELLRERVMSHAAVNGFEGVSLSELHAAAESFAAWDLDRDGVLSKEEGLSVLTSLAADAGIAGGGAATINAETLDRLFNLLDAAGDGVVDFNEFLAMRRQLQL